MAEPLSDRTLLEARVSDLIDVMTRFSAGDWQARAERDHSGDPWDVLAFMINATVEEIGALVSELRLQRETLELTQRQLLHSAKLAALGELAGGVAHELNQPLTAIHMVVELMRRAEGPAREGHLQLIGDAAARMSTIVDSVRTFARQSPLRVAPMEAVEPLEAALRLMMPSLQRAGIVVTRRFAEHVPRITGDSDRLQQVFVNLLANARDALVAQGREPCGEVTVELFPDGGDVKIAVRDDGPGVAAGVHDRVFEPFFTTKTVGEGTGLGLSVSYGIVEEHGGAMICERVAAGACFVVRLPALAEVAS